MSELQSTLAAWNLIVSSLWSGMTMCEVNVCVTIHFLCSSGTMAATHPRSRYTRPLKATHTFISGAQTSCNRGQATSSPGGHALCSSLPTSPSESCEGVLVPLSVVQFGLHLNILTNLCMFFVKLF